MSDVRIMAWNVIKFDERPPLRDWEPLASLVRAHRPDILLLQELDGTSGKPHDEHGRPVPTAPVDTRQADRLGAELGMRIRIADSPSTVHTAIAWHPRLHLEHFEELTAPLLHHGQSLATLGHPEWAHPLTVASVHFNPFSVPAALIEAQIVLAHLRTHSPWAALAGDVNAPPLGDAPPPWAQLPPHNVAARAAPAPGPPRPNLDVAHALAHGDLIDAAAHLADLRQDPSLRAPTGQGHLRVDQVHLASVLAPGLRDYQRLSPAGLSDHCPLRVDLDLGVDSRTPGKGPHPGATS